MIGRTLGKLHLLRLGASTSCLAPKPNPIAGLASRTSSQNGTPRSPEPNKSLEVTRLLPREVRVGHSWVEGVGGSA